MSEQAKQGMPDLMLDSSELDSLRQRLADRALHPSDYEIIIKILELVVKLRTTLEKKRSGILKLIRMIFGLKTEKTRPRRGSTLGQIKSSSGNPCPRKKGRNGRDDYPGAKSECVDHDSLRPGDVCPGCLKGKLAEDKPAASYGWSGRSPVSLTIFLLQRLVCNLCKAVYTATIPESVPVKTVDDSKDEIKTGRCDANAGANAMIVLMRFQFGVPNYRMAAIQGHAGIPLPEATQNKMALQVYTSAIYVFEALISISADGDLFQDDDTRMRVLDILQTSRKEASGQSSKKQRTSTRTSVIVARTDEKQLAVLYFTGTAVAGENLAWVLATRSKKNPAPTLMCDGASQNLPNGHEVRLANCLGHARRKFYELNEKGHDLAGVLSLFGQVYVVDMQAKMMKLDDKERLALHKKHSTPVMNRLKEWMKESLKENKYEENSDVGDAINYCLNRWGELTLFLREPGVPITNDLAEQMLKIPVVRHRKASLQFKTADGALRGDVFMSLIATCEKCGANSLHYMEMIQIYRPDVMEHPELWLPWNYLDRLEKVSRERSPPERVPADVA